MTIQVDNRAGSAQMAPLLRKLGEEVELTQMPYGDVAFLGYGVQGAPVSVGIEMKSLSDVLACIQSGRFAGHQLPGLVQSYDYVWLLVEGVWRSRPQDGVLEYRREGSHGGQFWNVAGGGRKLWLWRDLESWLNTVCVMGGIRVHRVRDWNEGAAWIKTLHQWFVKEEHSSHLVMYSGKAIAGDEALLVRPSLVRRVAAELPGIGFKRSAAVASHFRTVAEMVSAPLSEWLMVDGVGRKTAADIVRGLNGGK